jgi:hypothetical protein
VISALDRYLDAESGGISLYSLAADLIPAKGAEDLQADQGREIARKAFGVARLG